MIRYIKAYGKDGIYLHLWAYEEFKQKLKAKVMDYELRGNLIEYIIYKVNLPEEYKNAKQLRYYDIYADVLDDYKE